MTGGIKKISLWKDPLNADKMNLVLAIARLGKLFVKQWHKLMR